MAALTLAVKYRPHTFEDVVEQGSTIQILKKQIETKTFKQAYLLTGPAGCGKTSVSRILASEINNGKGLPIEIDAASNNSIDNIRQIIQDSQMRAFDGEYKVYIIDECHMLSNSAWNAMLKLIEEPPAKTIFIFCTTDPQKIMATILSRVQRFDFSKISFAKVVSRLNEILNKEASECAEIKWEPDALNYIAKLADGGMRDAITMLDKCLSYNTNVTLDIVVSALGTVDYSIMFNLTNSIIDRETLKVIEIINTVYNKGTDLKQFIKQYSLFLIDIVKFIKSKSFDFIKIPNIYLEQLKSVSEGVEEQFFYKFMQKLILLNDKIKWDKNAKAAIEAELILECVGD